MDDDDSSLTTVLRSELTEYLEGVEDIDVDELASNLALRAESHFGM
ncbi:hypothetical protein ABZ656_32860 [Streptomyces sp. NPDC007095]|jgi:hypothetical protein